MKSETTITAADAVITASQTRSEISFACALASGGPSPEIPESALMYAPLIGQWRVHATDYAADGTTYELDSEWYFSWVLEGRAVQDVWIAPLRTERFPGMPKAHNRFGSTFRMYDASSGLWNLDWFNPVNGTHNQLVARKCGAEIVQEGMDGKGNHMRWTFLDITSDSFRWTGEISTDQGHSWFLHAVFLGRRM